MTAEATGNEYNQVHVLRQAFRPNEPLRAALSSLVKRSEGSRPFSLLGSDERVIDLHPADAAEFNIQQNDAIKYMESRQNLYIPVEAYIKARLLQSVELGPRALQLVLAPADIVNYRRATYGLDYVKFGKRQVAVGHEALHMYINIPINQLHDDIQSRVNEMRGAFASDPARLLYQVTPVPHLLDLRRPPQL